MLYIINLQPCAFPFYEQILKKDWTSEYDYFSVFVLLIDGECVMLLYLQLAVNCGQSGHGQSGQTRNLMREKSSKDSIYK